MFSEQRTEKFLKLKDMYERYAVGDFDDNHAAIYAQKAMMEFDSGHLRSAVRLMSKAVKLVKDQSIYIMQYEHLRHGLEDGAYDPRVRKLVKKADTAVAAGKISRAIRILEKAGRLPAVNNSVGQLYVTLSDCEGGTTVQIQNTTAYVVNIREIRDVRSDLSSQPNDELAAIEPGSIGVFKLNTKATEPVDIVIYYTINGRSSTYRATLRRETLGC